jgi:hypothetical protein
MNCKKLFAIILCVLMFAATLEGCNTAKPKSKGLYNGYDDYQFYKTVKSLSGSILGSTPETSYDGYLGYGYDVVKSDYFNSKDIHISSPVLDTNKLVAAKLIYSRPTSVSSVNTITGSSSESFLRNLTAKTSISTSGLLFQGSFSASFASSTSTSSKQSYIKTIMTIGERRDYVLLSDIGIDDLKKYTTTTFKNMVNDNTKTAKQVFDTYGTHVLLDIQMGGRMDLNYSYHNTESISEEDLSACASEVYNGVKAKESASLSEKAKKFFENSSFTSDQYGGTTDDNISTLSDAQDAYTTWSSSLENSKKLDFIGAADPKNPAAFIPVWELADSAQRQTDLQNYYNDLVAENGDKGNGVTYVKDIYFGIDKKEAQKAQSNLTANMQTANPGSSNVELTKYDLNNKAGGDYIYMGYTLTTDQSQAITGLIVKECDESDRNNISDTENVNGVPYKKIKVDLNENARGPKSVYLYYTKQADAGNPLTQIGIEYGEKQYSFPTSSDRNWEGWSKVNTPSGGKLDLNVGAGSDSTDIFMWQRRTTDGSDINSSDTDSSDADSSDADSSDTDSGAN